MHSGWKGRKIIIGGRGDLSSAGGIEDGFFTGLDLTED